MFLPIYKIEYLIRVPYLSILFNKKQHLKSHHLHTTVLYYISAATASHQIVQLTLCVHLFIMAQSGNLWPFP